MEKVNLFSLSRIVLLLLMIICFGCKSKVVPVEQETPQKIPIQPTTIKLNKGNDTANLILYVSNQSSFLLGHIQPLLCLDFTLIQSVIFCKLLPF